MRLWSINAKISIFEKLIFSILSILIRNAYFCRSLLLCDGLYGNDLQFGHAFAYISYMYISIESMNFQLKYYYMYVSIESI
jgi:hypothetical protein